MSSWNGLSFHCFVARSVDREGRFVVDSWLDGDVFEILSHCRVYISSREVVGTRKGDLLICVCDDVVYVQTKPVDEAAIIKSSKS